MADTDPVKLDGRSISLMLYADDLLIVSQSSKGMQKALDLLEEYCHRWQLIVNTNKTKGSL